MGTHFQEDIIQSTKDKIFKYGLTTFDRAFAFYGDGLKPVNRRILYLLWEDKVWELDKVGTIAGAVMRYHPHGDKSIADAIVKMGQWFYANYVLIDPQGNYGTTDGDPASAPRYIECRPSEFARDVLLEEIDSQCIDYKDNYDYKRREPVYLPSKLPLLLVEGSMGIGEAFSASIPSHNLTDVVNKSIMFIKNKNIDNEDLCEGLFPDFPTGGEIMNGLEVRANYTKGVPCTIKIRGRAEVDPITNTIMVFELPFGVTFDKINSAIFEDKQKYKDESVFKDIIRSARNNDKGYFEIEVKKDANASNILLELFNKTKLEDFKQMSFIINYGQSVKTVTVKEIISDWYDFRVVTKQRKFIFEMNTIQNKTHILEGIIKCHLNLDAVIDTVRKSGDRNDCILKLHKGFGLTMVQARGIADMSVASLSRHSSDELNKLVAANKKRIEEIIHNLTILDELIIAELKELNKKYARPRRTKVNLEVGGGKKKSSDALTISVDNGLLLYTNQAVGLYDQEFLLHGKKITGGLPRNHRVFGGFPVGSDLKQFVIFSSDATAQLIDISDLPALQVWKQYREKNIAIDCIAPLTGHKDEVILCLLETGHIKAIKADDIGNRVNQIGKRVISCATSKGMKDNIILIDKKSHYLYLLREEFPLVGRAAGGNKTTIENPISKGFKMVLMNSQSPSAVVVFHMESLEDKQGYILVKSVSSLNLSKRTNKPKTLVDHLETYSIKGGQVMVVRDSKSELIIVGDSDMTSISMRHVKDTGLPKKTPVPPISTIIYQ